MPILQEFEQKGKETLKHLRSQGYEAVRQIYHYCQGCEQEHVFTVGQNGWTFNNNFEKPTFSPSMLINKHDPKTRCHYFIKNGQIQFLSDCHHALAGQTLDLIDLDIAFKDA